MDLIVDANIIFAALIKESHTRHLLVLSNHTFYVPEYVFKEIKKYLPTIEKKASLPQKTIIKILEQIITLGKIKIIPQEKYLNQIKKAEIISPDPDDIHYFALALHLNCGIWTNDKKLKEQNQINVYNTKEISKHS